NNEKIKTVGVGNGPYGVAVNPVTNLVYVANSGGSSVSVIDGGTNEVIATVEVGVFPRGVAVNPNTNRRYVANDVDDTVSVISMTYVEHFWLLDGLQNDNDVEITAVGVGDGPYGVAVNPVTNLVYVANFASNTVTVIDGNNNNEK